ncbi:hypothetical protein CRUP_012569 [Coryphaenoides rupestris]|nr:hypothetical protein CRUP_012569 [Coryphaenoides rupestris]
MWEQEDFERHWRNEFPDGEAPRMRITSVADIEAELDKCKESLRRLQGALAEERFKVVYLQTTITRHKRGYEQERSDTGSKVSPHKGAGEPMQQQQEHQGVPDIARLRSRARKPILLPPRTSSLAPHKGTPTLLLPTGGVSEVDGNHVGRFKPVTSDPRQDAVSIGGDHDVFEDLEMNENFVKGNLLVGPRAVERTEQHHHHHHHHLQTPTDLLRPTRHARTRDSELDPGDDGRLSPSWTRGSRGSGCSTPDRRSDGNLSSDHDDSSSAGTGGDL